MTKRLDRLGAYALLACVCGSAKPAAAGDDDPPAPPPAEAAVCTELYSEGVQAGLRNMVARYGEFRGLHGLVANKPPKMWNELKDRCQLTTTIETEKGAQLASSAASCVAPAGTPVCETNAGSTIDLQFKKPGKFRLKVTGADSKLLFDLPFQIVQWDKTTYVSRSDWDNMGALVVTPEGLQFEMVIVAASQAEADKLEKAIQPHDFTLGVAVRRGKKVVGTGQVRTGFRAKSGDVVTAKLTMDVEGAEIPLKSEHLAQAGDYVVEVTMGKKVWKKYPFKVKDNAIVLHPRQAPGYAVPGRAFLTSPTGPDSNYRPPAPRFWLEAK